jgi:hypothetical protein
MVCPHCNADLVPYVSGPLDLSDWTPPLALICCRSCDKPVPAVLARLPEPKGSLVDLPKAA